VGGWRRLRHEELHNLYASPNVTAIIQGEWDGGVCSTHRRDEKLINIYTHTQSFGWKIWTKEITLKA